MAAERGCALVTGASRGIGAATARALAAEGWAIGVSFRRDEEAASALAEELAATGAEALAVRADVRSQEDVERLFGELESRHGRVSVLVNCAGITEDGLTPALKDDQWQAVLETNLGGPFRTCRRALMPMVRARFGRIVNVASVVGPVIGNQGQSNYAAAKAGLVGMTRSIAREVAHRGVTANAVAPGLVVTEMTTELDSELVSSIPARRGASPEEVAAAIRFLVSEDASYVTGTTLVVDGGMTA